jgi:hypothetical protein
MRTATSSIDGSEVVPGREGFLLSSHSRKVIERNLNSIHMWNSPKRTFSPGFQTAPTSATWSYWFDWLYFLMDHPFGEAFHEPPQCMNCGRCLDDIGVQECPGCGEDPWQWWFQWFYARHAPEDLTDRSWDLFQLHTYADGRIFHPRTEGWISSLTHIPIQEEGRFRLEVASKAVVAAPGMLTVADGLAELGIWHSIAFGPFPATSIGHTSYFDMKGNPVEYAHRSPFEQLVMRETMDGREGSVDVDMMPGVDRYTIRDQCLPPSGEAIIGVSTLRTSEIKDGRERWTALTPIIDGPGAFIVREEVTYILEDPLASGYRSISPNYNGQVGGWFEPLVYRVIGPIC